MNYMDVQQASKKWGISDRRIRILCNEGRVDGAVKLGWSWTIPEDAPKPRDGRVLRRFKNLDIRPGSIDVARLERLKEAIPVDRRLKENKAFESVIVSSLHCLLKKEGKDISKEEIETIFSGSIVPSLSLEDHLICINFRSIIFSLIDKKTRWFEGDLKEDYIRLLQGIDDISSNEYRDGFTRYAIREREKVKVSVQMETMFTQYESSWKNLHGLLSGILLYGELLRIEPFGRYGSLFAYIVLSGELLRNGILPPLFTADSLDVVGIAFSMALKRGNYSDFTAFIEQSVISCYGEIANV